MNRFSNKEGFVLTAVLMLLVVAALVGGAFLFSVRNSQAVVERWAARDECLYGVQSGIEQAKWDVDQIFQAEYATNKASSCLEVLERSDETKSETWPSAVARIRLPHVVTSTVEIAYGTVKDGPTPFTFEIEVEFTGNATHRGIARRMRETVVYTWSPYGPEGTVFDFSMFVNAAARFDMNTSGVNVDFNGDVFSNGDVEFKQQNAARMNGDVYAGGMINITMNYDDLGTGSSKYGGQGDRTRPMSPANYGLTGDLIPWEQGYAGTVNYYENQRKKDMPFLADLQEYIDFATKMGGTVKKGTTTIATGSYGNYPATSPTNDCLLLIGTSANPIKIDGPVLVTGDIYIMGYYEGQGALYAGRNIHIIGDLIAKNPATWSKPDSTPEATATANGAKDFLGLMAKGNLILGEYDTKSPMDKITGYVTQGSESFATDPSDSQLGYISGTKDGKPYFDGDYTKKDGGTRTDGTDRYFYDPWFSHAQMAAIPDQDDPKQIDAVLYANRMISGSLGVSAQINGALVCRDFFTKTSTGNTSINWDIRLGTRSVDGAVAGNKPWGKRFSDLLVREGSVLQIVKWSELAPESP